MGVRFASSDFGLILSTDLSTLKLSTFVRKNSINDFFCSSLVIASVIFSVRLIHKMVAASCLSNHSFAAAMSIISRSSVVVVDFINRLNSVSESLRTWMVIR